MLKSCTLHHLQTEGLLKPSTQRLSWQSISSTGLAPLSGSTRCSVKHLASRLLASLLLLPVVPYGISHWTTEQLSVSNPILSLVSSIVNLDKSATAFFSLQEMATVSSHRWVNQFIPVSIPVLPAREWPISMGLQLYTNSDS